MIEKCQIGKKRPLKIALGALVFMLSILVSPYKASAAIVSSTITSGSVSVDPSSYSLFPGGSYYWVGSYSYPTLSNDWSWTNGMNGSYYSPDTISIPLSALSMDATAHTDAYLCVAWTYSGGTFNTVSNPPCFHFVSNGSTWSVFTPTPPDTSSRIIDFTPENGTTTGNEVTFSLHGYVSPDDFGSGFYQGVTFTLHNIDENVLIVSAFSPNDIYFLSNYMATSSGDFYYSTTTSIGDGDYRLNAQLNHMGIATLLEKDQNLSHTFVVNQETYIGHLQQNIFNELNGNLASTSATSSAVSLASCNPLAFDVTTCLTSLFVPDSGQLNDSFKSFYNGVATRFPIGYLTRFIAILSGGATTTLPAYTVNLYTAASTTTALTFDIGDTITGAGNLLDSIKDPTYGKTLKDVCMPFVQLGVALMVLFSIIQDVTKAHGGGGLGSGRTKGGKVYADGSGEYYIGGRWTHLK